MGSNIRLGRIAGIEFGVYWSWFVVFALIVWTLASGIFPSTNPGLSKGTHIAMAIVAAFFFFLSILLHEFGHALQARREGIEIDGITLWLFGGVARFKGSFRSAGAEFRVAIAGPLVSLLLGGLFVGIALIPGLPSAVDGVVSWLGYINLSLLVFNLISAPPLDVGSALPADPAGPDRAARPRRDDPEPGRRHAGHHARRVHGQRDELAAPHHVSGGRPRESGRPAAVPLRGKCPAQGVGRQARP